MYKLTKNNNPINRKEMKYKNNDDEFEENIANNKTKRKIKIVNKNSNKENENNSILLNKKEKYEKNWNDQYSKIISIDTTNNVDYPHEFQSPISINTKVKNDPLKFITQYYLAKDKLNKITKIKKHLKMNKVMKKLNTKILIS